MVGISVGTVRSSDINRMNEDYYIAIALDVQVVMFMDFHFDLTLISAFVGWWHPETHSFHMSWSEITIALQNVVYHLGLCTHGDPIGGAMRDFQQFYRRPSWGIVEQLPGSKHLVNLEARKESFLIKITWLRLGLQHIPKDQDDDTMR
ncbi:hypothetical protein PIB30_086786 [Stylosanthes scabra]|uniref:Aminotransferase-like plant mobile domain-containing protein n=1 Tax=Stylosanthes scabra TaxID=79078 RepID=A0ABU6USN2_9FABA|nr:hypothetical protein [Stylosanthes scabra]